MSMCDSSRAPHGAGVGLSDNCFPDSGSRYGESLIVNGQHTMQSMVILLSIPPHPMQSLENHKDMYDHTRQR